MASPCYDPVRPNLQKFVPSSHVLFFLLERHVPRFLLSPLFSSADISLILVSYLGSEFSFSYTSAVLLLRRAPFELRVL